MKNRMPSYRLHKSSGLAVVTLNSKDYYLGKHGSEESIAEYRRLTSLYAANGMTMPAPRATVTVNELLLRYYDHACTYYRKNGQPTSQCRIVKVVCRRMRDLFGATDVATLGSANLIALRDSWVRDGSTRITVNRKIEVARRIIDWGVTQGIVPGPVSHTARSVRGLARGRTTAPDHDPVRPVPDNDMKATIGQLDPRTGMMVCLQLLTGMRPGEVCQIRGRDIDQSTPVWTYTPKSHKTEHRIQARIIALGPQAQEILSVSLSGMAPDRYAFSKSGKSPRDVGAYRRAIATACRRAGIAPWSPNRLRHNFATRVRRQFGLDAAQVCLGHTGADVTQIYAEVDLSKAMEVATAIG